VTIRLEKVSADDFFAELPLINFMECMRDAIHMRDTLKWLRDEAVRDTDKIHVDQSDARRKIYAIVERAYSDKIIEEVNNALKWLDMIVEEVTV
jgi:hypothetical protein